MFNLSFKKMSEPEPKDHCFIFNSQSELLVFSDDPLSSLNWEYLQIANIVEKNRADSTAVLIFLGTENSDQPNLGTINVWLIKIAPETLQEKRLPPELQWLAYRPMFRDLIGQNTMPYFRAYHVNSWLDRFHFCPSCASELCLSKHEVALQCTSCTEVFYPTISPAIIVAVTRNNGSEILLGQGKNRTSNWYSLIAGFCEAGESIEQTVVREVFEETGVTVSNIQYQESQGWPFSQSLMLGFIAEYHGGTIQHDPEELDSAGWYSLDALPQTPPPPSIANKLISIVQTRHKKKQPPIGG